MYDVNGTFLGGIVEAKPFVGYIRQNGAWVAACSGNSPQAVSRELATLYGIRDTLVRRAGDSPNEVQ